MAASHSAHGARRSTSPALEQFRELLARYPQYRAWPEIQPKTLPAPEAPPAATELRAAWETVLADDPAAGLALVHEAERATRRAAWAGDRIIHAVAVAILDERTRPTLRHS